MERGWWRIPHQAALGRGAWHATGRNISVTGGLDNSVSKLRASDGTLLGISRGSQARNLGV